MLFLRVQHEAAMVSRERSVSETRVKLPIAVQPGVMVSLANDDAHACGTQPTENETKRNGQHTRSERVRARPPARPPAMYHTHAHNERNRHTRQYSLHRVIMTTITRALQRTTPFTVTQHPVISNDMRGARGTITTIPFQSIPDTTERHIRRGGPTASDSTACATS